MSSKNIVSESKLNRVLFEKACRQKVPLNGTFELSPICNLACSMCYVRKTEAQVRSAERKMLTLEMWLQLAEEMKKEGMLYLLLTGGEPFLWPYFWELYEKLVNMGFVISINSNGTLIDEDVIRKLKKHPPTRINITLYGASDDTYEKLCKVKGMYQKVDEAIEKLKSAGIRVKLNCSLTPANAHDLEKIIEYARRKQLILEVACYMFPPIRRNPNKIGDNFRFTPEETAFYNMKKYMIQHDEKENERFLRDIVDKVSFPLGLDEDCLELSDEKVRCRAGKASFWVTWDGWMTPCGMLSEPKVDIWKETGSNAWKTLVEEVEQVRASSVCGKCSNRKICHSCIAMAKCETGKTDGIPQYLCKEVVEIRRLAEEKLKQIENKLLNNKELEEDV